MPILKIIKSETNIKFMKIKKITLFLSLTLFLLSLGSIIFKGLNLGIDFTGGTLIEARFDKKINLNDLRIEMNKLDLGEIQLQTIGNQNDVVIRVQEKQISSEKQSEAIEIIKNSLKESPVEYRRTEYVGPKVGGELVNAGIIAVIFFWRVANIAMNNAEVPLLHTTVYLAPTFLDINSSNFLHLGPSVKMFCFKRCIIFLLFKF